LTSLAEDSYIAIPVWLRAVRSRLLARGLAAFLAVLVCGGALDWGHAGGDDPDCNPVFVHHDHNAHRFSAATHSTPPADHCYLCHSLRLLHTLLVARGARIAVASESASLLRSDALAAVTAVSFGLSPRAPPTASL
jgi:hypothetical protein